VTGIEDGSRFRIRNINTLLFNFILLNFDFMIFVVVLLWFGSGGEIMKMVEMMNRDGNG
jgi:hypothetical protein